MGVADVGGYSIPPRSRNSLDASRTVTPLVLILLPIELYWFKTS